MSSSESLRPDQALSTTAGQHRRRELAQAFVLVFAFVVLMGAGSVVGFNMMQSSRPAADTASEAADPHRASQVVYKSADGLTCRRVIFDNASGLFRKGRTEPCYQPPKEEYRQRSFNWGR